ASLGIEREVAPGFSIAVSGIYSHTTRLPVAIDTNLLPSTPTTTVMLANGAPFTSKNWSLVPATDPFGGTEPGGLPCGATKANPFAPFACFVNPLITQNN